MPKSEKLIFGFRQFALHSSCAGFGMDFAHACFGNAMIFARLWEHNAHLGVSWAAFAATLIVYIDGHEAKAERQRSAEPLEERLVQYAQ